MEAIGGVKIFKMNDCDWYAAATEEDALKCMADTLCCKSIDECREEYVQDGPIVELHEAYLDSRMFFEEDEDGGGGESRSFRAQLMRMIASGETFPAFFASSEF